MGRLATSGAGVEALFGASGGVERLMMMIGSLRSSTWVNAKYATAASKTALTIIDSVKADFSFITMGFQSFGSRDSFRTIREV